MPVKTLKNEEADIYVRMRYGPSGYVFSREPGSEGRPVSEDEAVSFVTEFQHMGGHHVRWLSRSIWISLALFIILGILASKLRSGALGPRCNPVLPWVVLRRDLATRSPESFQRSDMAAYRTSSGNSGVDT